MEKKFFRKTLFEELCRMRPGIKCGSTTIYTDMTTLNMTDDM